MTQNETDHLRRGRESVAASYIRSQELRAHSKELIAQAKKLSEKVEDVHKRAVALRAAIKLAHGDTDYILKQCGCGRKHRVPEWFELPFVGYQEHKVMGGEMRNCTCNSTLLFITRREAA